LGMQEGVHDQRSEAPMRSRPRSADCVGFVRTDRILAAWPDAGIIAWALSLVIGTDVRLPSLTPPLFGEAGLVLTRDPHAQFPATLTKVVVHLRGIQSAMHLLLSRPKVTVALRDGGRGTEQGIACVETICYRSQLALDGGGRLI